MSNSCDRRYQPGRPDVAMALEKSADSATLQARTGRSFSIFAFQEQVS